MNWDINVVAGLVAGVAAMAPGAIIYDPRVLGKQWMKETGHVPGKGSAAEAVSKMFVTSLVSGLMASLVVWTIGATSVGDAVLVALVLGWFWVSANLMLVFFENRSWKWFQISALSHILTALVIGVVLGLFL
jgi:hypothetical protein